VLNLKLKEGDGFLRLALDYCVFYTAMDAIDFGFDVFVVVDATRGISPTSIQTSIQEMTNAGIKILQSDQVRQNIRCQ
jgi:nicotinamidase/pyrazinamidase